MRPRKNGGFIEPFDPYQVDFNFTEANAWQYGLFVPHDIATFTDYIGGKDSLEHWLDRLFTAPNLRKRTSRHHRADWSIRTRQRAKPSRSFLISVHQSS